MRQNKLIMDRHNKLIVIQRNKLIIDQQKKLIMVTKYGKTFREPSQLP